jgi:hypothetical protein
MQILSIRLQNNWIVTRNNMKKLKIYMYTRGTGSGHLTRVNAVYKGFVRAGIDCDFYASAYRSKYKSYLDPGIILSERDEFPESIDIFICDWLADDFVFDLPQNLAKVWVGLRRLGKIKSTFPNYFYVVAMELGVEGDICIWPIISTWEDELLTKEELHQLLHVPTGKPIGLLCENGAYPKHLDKVFSEKLPSNLKVFCSSNSPFAEGRRDINYYPIAKLFKAADYLVIGGGYNSVHEALSYADMEKTKVNFVGGDDQKARIKNMSKWERGRGSQAHVLAEHIVKLLP